MTCPPQSRGPRALTPAEAKSTLAARFGPKADRLRQLATKFGVRPYRVFLVWTVWSGVEVGEGNESEIKRVEILPTPVVESLDGVSKTFYAIGTLPVGTIRLTRVSPELTFDTLTGRIVPVAHEDHIPDPFDFFYEISEDGRGDPDPLRLKFRVLTEPVRRAGKLDWVIGLERISEDCNRQAQSNIGPDKDQ